MRTAILIYGEYRTMDEVSSSWIFDKCFKDYDVFVSTWDYCNEYKLSYSGKNMVKTKSGGFTVTEDMVKRNVPNGIIKISQFIEQPTYCSMAYHYRTGLDMINSMGKEYDSILIMRCDLEFTRLLNNKEDELIEEIPNKVIYGNSPIYIDDIEPTKYYTSEIIFFEKYEIMNKVFSSIPTNENTHHTYAEHILNNNHYLKQIGIYPQFSTIVLVRDNGVRLII